MISGQTPETHRQRISIGCPQHPEYKGEGSPPDPCCGRCLFIHSSWKQLQDAMQELLKD